MGIEVASLTASFDFKVKGEEAVQRSFAQLQQAQQALQATAGDTTASVAAQQLKLSQLSKQLSDATSSYQQATDEIAKTGITMDTVSTKFNNANKAIAAADEKMSGLRDQLSTTSRAYQRAQKELALLQATRVKDSAAIEKQKKVLADLKEQMAKLTAETEKWQNASADAEQQFSESLQEAATIGDQKTSYEEMVTTTDKLERATGKLGGTTKGATRSTRLGREEMSRWISMARSGNLSNELLATGFQKIQSGTVKAATGTGKLAGMLGKLGSAGVIAAVVGVVAVVTALYKAISKTVQIADQLNEISGFFGPLDDDMQKVAESARLTNSALGSLLGTARNQGQAVGIKNAVEYAEQIAKISDELRYLGPNKDFGKAFQVIEAAVRGSLQPLEDYGIRTDRITQSLEDLGPATSEAERRATILAGVQKELAARSDDVTKRMKGEKTTMADVKAEFARMWETVAHDLAPALSDLLATIKPLVKNFTYLMRVLIVTVSWVAKIGTALYKFMILPLGVLAKEAAKVAKLLGAGGLASTLDDMGNNLLDAVFGIKKASNELGDFSANIDDSVGAAQRAKVAFQEMRTSLSGGFSAIGSAKDLAISLEKLNTGTGNTAENLLQVGENYTKIIDAAANNDLNAQLDTLDTFMQGLADRSEITTEQFNNWQDMLGATKDVLQPVIDLTDDMKNAAAQTESPMNHAADSIGNAGTTAETATGQVQGLTSALEQMTGTYEANVVVNMAGQGGVTIGGTAGGGAGGFSLAGTLRSFAQTATQKVMGALGIGNNTPTSVVTARNTPSETRGYATTPKAASVNDRSLNTAARTAATHVQETTAATTSDHTARSAASRLAGMFPSGGGGGGGGGAKLATADDIRKFISEVNRAIVAGIRGGKVFSTAGNAIPLTEGGFISSQGGSLVENVTIKGVWDFADPAAKREIVRQLREALSDLSKEVA